MIAGVWCPWCRDHQRAELTADRDALRRELDALRQTHAGDLARERERAEAAEHTLTVEREAAGALVEVATAARARAEAAERECAGLRAIVEGRTTAPTEPTCECGHPVDMHRGADRCGAHGCGCDRNAEEASWR